MQITVAILFLDDMKTYTILFLYNYEDTLKLITHKFLIFFKVEDD